MEDLFRNGERSVRDRDLFFLTGEYSTVRSWSPMTGGLRKHPSSGAVCSRGVN
jgi:hypothetical protein